MAKIKQSETVTIKRSSINFAPYNPRKKDPKVIEALKANFRKVGFMGGVVWNEATTNLVGGHKRVEAMDLINDYPNKDYDIKVEKVSLDDKTEKEQNIFLNNKRVQGETDFEMLASILPDIDIQNTGLSDYDLQIINSIVPVGFDMGDNSKILNDSIDLTKEYNQNKQAVKDLKKKMKSEISDNQRSSYFTITFETYNQKAEFLSSIGINEDIQFIRGDEFIEKLEQ